VLSVEGQAQAFLLTCAKGVMTGRRTPSARRRPWPAVP
jgi:hypothetical protein